MIYKFAVELLQFLENLDCIQDKLSFGLLQIY
jgi:hypothetical protein